MWMVYGHQGVNYFQLSGPTSVAGGIQWICNGPFMNSISPQTAYYLDSKMDDGAPLAGSVQAAVGGPGPGMQYNLLATPAAPASGVCVSNAAQSPYNVGDFGDVPACQLRLKLF